MQRLYKFFQLEQTTNRLSQLALHFSIKSTQIFKTVLPLIVQLDPQKYQWRQSETDPLIWKRPVCGVEALVSARTPTQTGAFDFYFSVTVQIHSSDINLEELEYAIRSVWRETRIKHPDVALSPAWNAAEQCFLEHRAPQSEAEMTAWLDNTVFVEASKRAAMEIRAGIEEIRSVLMPPQASPAVSIHMAAPVSDKSSKVKEEYLTFLFIFNHLPFDGIGARILIGNFFRDLGAQLTKETRQLVPNLSGRAEERLTPAPLLVLAPGEEISGPKFCSAFQGIASGLMSIQGSWGLKPMGTPQGRPQTLFHTFSVAEGGKILRAVKERLGPGYTITHLAQAAVLLSILKSNPLPKNDDEASPRFTGSTIVLNGRRSLSEAYANNEIQYLGNTQSNGSVRFDNIREYQVSQSSSKEDIRGYLTKAATVTKQSYDSCLQRPSQLPAAIASMELIASMISSGRVSTGDMTTPIITSDGIDDRFIPREVASGSKELLSIQDVYHWTNSFTSYPTLRLYTFRDTPRLSIDWNETAYSITEMDTFLADTAGFMLALTD